MRQDYAHGNMSKEYTFDLLHLQDTAIVCLAIPQQSFLPKCFSDHAIQDITRCNLKSIGIIGTKLINGTSLWVQILGRPESHPEACGRYAVQVTPHQSPHAKEIPIVIMRFSRLFAKLLAAA